ncbi:topoisomerase DNA-binding C4 zinc finger domain-containing protein, partial [Patescibacteria group bacterium]|nr:topoisomerase DNA-binding C4 zinc finger domain-containing protein [Patescibacteria group bacterium]
IRPVDISILPKDVKDHLEKDLYRLYELIWKRTVACQMAEARLKQTAVDIDAKGTGYELRANGQVIEFPGFMKVYKESTDDGDENGENILPELEAKDALDAKGFDSKQHFTKPPPRYTEASLVKKLEAEGIGRPSTYAPTISTIQTREYVKREARTLFPTDLGMIVNDLLVKHFFGIVDYKFTAEMEDQLDQIAEGKKKWVPVIDEFYKPFHKLIVEKSDSIKKEDIIQETTKEKCDECGSKMLVKFGRFGKFLSCSNYPDCKFAKPMEGSGQPKIDPATVKKFKDAKCEKCGEPMTVKMGRFGEFLGCSGYPKCKNIKSIPKYVENVVCPKCKAKLVQRFTRKGGKVFYGCSAFPKCKFATWNKPVKKCKCGGLIVEKGKKLVCEECKAETELKGASKK